MDTADRPIEFPDGGTGLPKLERSLRRALATTESDEARYHIRTALQYLDVLRVQPGDDSQSSRRRLERR
ncbi:hypothetical protein [Halobaculum magnesiiphilum]|uniref:Uncharacterized protein n=1 Tax=Halobaculum magnesiiphilum TaxID=1017351 RepID=A0A8T8WIM8_9EURY|nr:hypothetical protein [Halobaculum magnesiiphilum]QZP39687.1 hypothetical protein K6T50_17040 [Halobaculum magnesiiphilum]